MADPTLSSFFSTSALFVWPTLPSKEKLNFYVAYNCVGPVCVSLTEVDGTMPPRYTWNKRYPSIFLDQMPRGVRLV